MSDQSTYDHLSDHVWRQRGKYFGFVAGVMVPLVVVGLFLVSFRGYGISDNPPMPPQIYSDF